MSENTFSGTVCFYDSIAGNGFIMPDHGKGKIPFNYHAIQLEGYRTLDEGERVIYEIARIKSGIIANRVFCK